MKCYEEEFCGLLRFLIFVVLEAGALISRRQSTRKLRVRCAGSPSCRIMSTIAYEGVNIVSSP